MLSRLVILRCDFHLADLPVELREEVDHIRRFGAVVISQETDVEVLPYTYVIDGERHTRTKDV